MQRSESQLDLSTALPGTMMEVPLTIPWILEHALRNFASQEIVTLLEDGTVHRYTYADFGARVAQLAHALIELGVRPGDRVASFAWNTHRHLELYYAVPAIGAVLHTANIRLFPQQVIWSLEHADDRLIFVDGSLAPVMQTALATAPTFKRPFVIMGPPAAALPQARDYEELLAGHASTFRWPDIDERTAAILCYTSATTGHPKGVLFTHRSQVLHSFAASLPSGLGVSQRDVILPIVPMFHVNAWGLPYVTLMNGAKFVFPGARLDPSSIIDLVERERVTFSAAVPTVWLAVLDELRRRNKRLPTLERLIIGGSAVPPSLFDGLAELGIRVDHAWGMTEMSPIGTVNRLHPALDKLSPERRREVRLKQGTFTPIVAWKLLGEDGEPVLRDGKSRGELWVRGPAVAASYFRLEGEHAAFRDGWFHTGDICTIDELGYLQLVDRSKDLVKSGGEWISSVDLENTLMGHPAVKEAAVIGVPHAKWQERPVAIAVLREGESADEPALKAWLAERVAKWWVPDRVLFVDSIPRTGVGKFLKRELRDRYQDLLA